MSKKHKHPKRRRKIASIVLAGILAKKFDEEGEFLGSTIIDALEYTDELIKQLKKKP